MSFRHEAHLYWPPMSHRSRGDTVHWALAVQATHLFWVGSTALTRHWAVDPVHWVLLPAVQVTHLLTVVSQAGVLPEQLPSTKHWTHWFMADVAPSLHWLFGALQPKPVRHGTQVLVAVSQAGVPPEQSELVKHWTHLFSVGLAFTLQWAVAPLQPKPAVQATQISAVLSQAGPLALAAQSALAAHSTQ